MSIEKRDRTESLTRRDALAAIVGAGTAFAFGCSSSGGAEGASDAGQDGTSTAETGTCTVTPEGEIGPYFADDSAAGFNRSNIVSNLDGTNTQTGIPLTLIVTVLDGQKSCAPYVGAQIDIWHCNASGVYSDIAGENTSSEQWLRGYQITDANGKVTFTTVIPGWYAGRTTHIHLRVRATYSEASSTSDGTNTTQCFFDQTFVDTLSTSVTPYSAEGKNPTTNVSDHVYSQEEDGANLLALTGDNTSGYTAEVTIVLPITASYDASAMGGGPGGEGGPGGGGPPDGGPGEGGFPEGTPGGGFEGGGDDGGRSD
jgi:protocatechuate 3,4-dioxygenase beta subunit